VDKSDGDLFRRLVEKVRVESMVEVVFVFELGLLGKRYCEMFLMLPHCKKEQPFNYKCVVSERNFKWLILIPPQEAVCKVSLKRK
jgi:hypothetical protein